MSHVPQILVIVVCLVVAQLIVLRVGSEMTPASAELPQQPLSELPMQLEYWRGADTPLDERLTRGSGAEVMVNRVYENSRGESVLVNCGIWTTYETVIPHSPEACYPAAGWEILDSRDLPLLSEQDTTIQARWLLCQRDAERIALLFFCHLGDRVVIDHGSVRRLKQELRGTPDAQLPPAIKVTLQTSFDSPAAAESRLLEVGRLVFAETSQLK